MDYEKHVWGKGIIDLSKRNVFSLNLVRLLENFRKMNPLPLRILEVGCGGGANIVTLKRVFPNLEYYAFDISRKAIETVQLNDDKISYSICDAENFCFKENSFDFIFFFNVLEHISNPNLLLSELTRVLKPNSIVHFFVPIENQKGTLFSLNMRIAKLTIQRLKEIYAGHIHLFTNKDIFNYCVENNSKLVDVSYSYHIAGQIQDMFDYYYTYFKENKRVFYFLLKPLHWISYRVLYKLMYYEDALFESNSWAIGLHITALNSK